MATATETQTKCGNTGCTNQLDTTGMPKWCRECRARYQREYQILKMSRAETKGFVAGREAMRRMVVAEFEKLGSGSFEAIEVAILVQQMPGPQVSDDDQIDQQ